MSKASEREHWKRSKCACKLRSSAELGELLQGRHIWGPLHTVTEHRSRDRQFAPIKFRLHARMAKLWAESRWWPCPHRTSRPVPRPCPTFPARARKSRPGKWPVQRPAIGPRTNDCPVGPGLTFYTKYEVTLSSTTNLLSIQNGDCCAAFWKVCTATKCWLA